LMVELLIRLKNYDPSRGSPEAFAGVIIKHGVTRLAVRLKNERALFAPVSLDDLMNGYDDKRIGDRFAEEDGYLASLWPSDNPIVALERRLSLDRSLSTLSPEDTDLCAKLLAGSIGQMSESHELSRATLYRRLKRLRLSLLAAGLGPLQ
jgi:hypothetical protein